MTTTVKFGLTEMAESQAGKYLTFNEAINDTLVLVNAAVLDNDLTAPPVSPLEGDCYMVATGGTGAWADHDGEMTYLYNGAWRFIALEPHYQYYVVDEDTEVRVPDTSP